MEDDYISKRKLTKTLKYITSRKINVTLIDDHDCSYSGMRCHNEHTGEINKFEVVPFEDAEIKVIVNFADNESMEIWLNNMYYLKSFDLHSKIEYAHNNGDGTYSYFTIVINE